MTGLSSVAGTPLQAKVQTELDSAQRGTSRGVSTHMVTSGEAVVTLLRSAVKSVELVRAEADRQRAESQVQSEAESQTRSARKDPTDPLGQSLDMVV